MGKYFNKKSDGTEPEEAVSPSEAAPVPSLDSSATETTEGSPEVLAAKPADVANETDRSLLSGGAFESAAHEQASALPMHPLEAVKLDRKASPTLNELKTAQSTGLSISVRSALDPTPSNQFAPGFGIATAEPRVYPLQGKTDEQLLAVLSDPDLEVLIVEG